MSPKNLSNPISTGGGGHLFEAHVQASFLTLMLARGFAPCLAPWPINKIKLQASHEGYKTDDLVVFVRSSESDVEHKLLAQIKHSIGFTKGDKEFPDVIEAAWLDFNNSVLFKKKQDSIAVITGPLNIIDIRDTRTILDWARTEETAESYFRKVRMEKVSSKSKISKLEVFCDLLTRANNNVAPSDDEIFQFLRHFHILCYDLDIKAGVALSLLHSLIGQYSVEKTRMLWGHIVNEVQTFNVSAGTITRDSLPPDLIEAFETRVKEETIPSKLIEKEEPAKSVAAILTPLPAEFTVASLVGSWNADNGEDQDAMSLLAQEPYKDWIIKFQRAYETNGSIILLRENIWTVQDRLKLLEQTSSSIYKQDLDNLKSVAVSILSEKDPKFELPAEERFAAEIKGKKLKYSKNIREGISETLAVLGNYSDWLKNVPSGAKNSIAPSVLQEVFKNADWQLWGSLNYLLPMISEAAPDAFLDAVEKSLQANPNPFKQLFGQESGGIAGQNYLSGVLWSLEGLAWTEKYFIRSCLVLAELAKIDPGGNYANRPQNSLTTILLPWKPQTIAPMDKRLTLIKKIQESSEQVAWKTVISLLPKAGQSSISAHRPKYLRIE